MLVIIFSNTGSFLLRQSRRARLTIDHDIHRPPARDYQMPGSNLHLT